METPTAATREVTFVTPVLFAPWRCDEVALHQPGFPPQIATLGNCMIIDLPLEHIQ